MGQPLPVRLERSLGAACGAERHEAGWQRAFWPRRLVYFTSPSRSKGDGFYFYKLPLRHLHVIWMTKGPGLGKAVSGDREQGGAGLWVRGQGGKAPESTALITRDRKAKVASERATKHYQHKGCEQHTGPFL